MFYGGSSSGQMSLEHGLRVLLETQVVVTPRLDPGFQARDPDENTRGYVLALAHEVHELLDELDWKAWRPRPDSVDADRVADEFADVLAFLGILMMILGQRFGVTTVDLARAYRAKTRENLRRAADRTRHVDAVQATPDDPLGGVDYPNRARPSTA